MVQVQLTPEQVDDVLLDTLSDSALVERLIAWRREIDSVPYPELVSVGTARRVLRHARIVRSVLRLLGGRK